MRALAAVLVALLAAPAAAEDLPVDLELVLAVDVSRSMTPNELEIQRRGYAEALASAEVANAITRGAYGRIALTYFEWSGAYEQRGVVPWTLIESRADSSAFAGRLTARFDAGLRRTSISAALTYAAGLFEGNGYEGRRVIDISGDGPNNAGPPVAPIRDEVVARGVAINGLPLMTREGMGSQWQLDDLDAYYRACVIGGPGAFVIPVLDWSAFPGAVRRKLVLEIAGRPDRYAPRPVADFRFSSEPDYDCLIGERIMERFRDNGLSP